MYTFSGTCTPLSMSCSMDLRSNSSLSDVRVEPDGSLAGRKVDGSAPEETLQPAGSVAITPGQMHVSPDGKAVVWAGRNPGDTTGRAVMWTWSPVDAAAPGGGAATIQKVLAPQAGTISVPRYSPDGRWIAFMLLRQGRPTLMLRPASGQGPTMDVSLETNGAAPEWRGRQLIWRRAGESGVEVMAVDVSAGQRPSIPGARAGAGCRSRTSSRRAVSASATKPSDLCDW